MRFSRMTTMYFRYWPVIDELIKRDTAPEWLAEHGVDPANFDDILALCDTIWNRHYLEVGGFLWDVLAKIETPAIGREWKRSTERKQKSVPVANKVIGTTAGGMLYMFLEVDYLYRKADFAVTPGLYFYKIRNKDGLKRHLAELFDLEAGGKNTYYLGRVGVHLDDLSKTGADQSLVEELSDLFKAGKSQWRKLASFI